MHAIKYDNSVKFDVKLRFDSDEIIKVYININYPEYQVIHTIRFVFRYNLPYTDYVPLDLKQKKS